MSKHRTRPRSDAGIADMYFHEWAVVGVLVAAMLAALTYLVIYAVQPTTHYARFCGDEKSYIRVSVERCIDAKVGAQWLYAEEGDRLPKMGGDTSNASTHMTAVKHTATTVER